MYKSLHLPAVRELTNIIWLSASPFVKRRVIATLFLITAASVLTALGPIALKSVVDGFASQSSDYRHSFLLIGLYVLSQFTSRAIDEVRGFLYARAERRMFRTLSERMFAHVMRLPMHYHMDRETGAIAQILDNGLQGYQLVLNHLVFAVLPGTVQLVTALLVLLYFYHTMFLAAFCVGVVSFISAFAIFAIRIADAAGCAADANVASTGAMTDAILNCETVKMFAAETVVQKRVNHALCRTEEEWVSFYRRYARNGLGVALFYGVFVAIAMIYGVYEVQKSRMTIGAFVLVNTYILQAVRPIEMLGQAAQGLSQGVAMLGKMLELFREKTETLTSVTAGAYLGPGALCFERVSYSYRRSRGVLKDVSFSVPAGKTLGIVGSSGAGKSTIVRLLVRLIEPSSGRMLLDGVPTSNLSLSELRQAIGVVPQDTILLNDTVASNIALGRPASSQEEIERASRAARLHDFVVGLPDGYQTIVGERGVKLSGGERQRVAIARAALKRPRILVFDEATSSLDSHLEHDILQNMRRLSVSSTTLIIAHRLSTVMHADEIIVLGACEVVERGTHSELLGNGAEYASLWWAQQRASECDYRARRASRQLGEQESL